MLKKLFHKHGSQKGFTLVELLVAVAITAVIGSVITMSISQLFSVSISDKNRMTAVKQVENALHYINRDVQMADRRLISPDDGSTGYFIMGLNLQWTDYTLDPVVKISVDYTLDADGVLERVYTIKENNEEENIISTVTTNIASHIDSVNSYYSFDGEMLEIKITASVGGFKSVTESRTLQVKPRVN